MSVDLEDRGHALENEYFYKQEQELLEKMKAKLEAEKAEKSKLKDKCPVNTCQGHLKEVDFENIKIDICEKCGGVWLDAGELTQIMDHDENKSSWFHRVFK